MDIKQEFAYLAENKDLEQNEQVKQLPQALEKDLLWKMDSIKKQDILNSQVYAEIKAQYPALQTAMIQPAIIPGDSIPGRKTILIALVFAIPITAVEKSKLEN